MLSTVVNSANDREWTESSASGEDTYREFLAESKKLNLCQNPTFEDKVIAEMRELGFFNSGLLKQAVKNRTKRTLGTRRPSGPNMTAPTALGAPARELKEFGDSVQGKILFHILE